ncbi:unnamed protein product [Camellia sinensis]
MVETILFNLASKILGKIGSGAIGEVGKAWGVEQELNTLSDTLSTIKAVLLDAERLYDHSKYSIAMEVWFDRLQAAFYDADNLVDEFQYEVLQRQVTRTFQITGCGNLKSLPEGMQLLVKLKTVTIAACPNLTSLPSTMKNLAKLRNLEISNCPNLDLAGWEDFSGLRRLQ